MRLTIFTICPLETKFANPLLHHTSTHMIQVTNPILQSHKAIMECNKPIPAGSGTHDR